MNRTLWPDNRKVIIILLLLSHVVLVLSYLRGFFSYDYFTLWGIHPKSVWALSDVFISGADTVLNFTYHSILGNIFGALMILINPEVYPDWGWGVFITAINYGLLSWLCLIEKKTISALLIFTVILLIIPGTSLAQNMLGGYLDLTGTLIFLTGIVYYDQYRFKKSALMFMALILVKQTLWPWIVIFFASDLLSDYKRKEKYKNYIYPFILCFFAFAVMKLWYFNIGSIKEVLPFKLQDHALNLFRLLKLFGTPLVLFSGLLPILIALMIRKKREFRRELIFIFFGLLYIYLIYIFVIEVDQNDQFPSMKRYVLPLILPSTYLYFKKVDFEIHTKILLTILLFFLSIRLPEAITAIRDKRIDFNICRQKPEICVQSKPNRIKSEKCRIQIISRFLFETEFDYLIFHYSSLPGTLVFNSIDEITPRIKSKECLISSLQ